MFAHVQHVLSLKFCSHSTRNTAMWFEHYRENTQSKLLPNVTETTVRANYYSSSYVQQNK